MQEALLTTQLFVCEEYNAFILFVKWYIHVADRHHRDVQYNVMMFKYNTRNRVMVDVSWKG